MNKFILLQFWIVELCLRENVNIIFWMSFWFFNPIPSRLIWTNVQQGASSNQFSSLILKLPDSVQHWTKMWFLNFIGMSAYLRKSAYYFVMSVHLSACMLSGQLPPDRFLGNLILGMFIKNSWENPNLVKIRPKYWTLYMKT